MKKWMFVLVSLLTPVAFAMTAEVMLIRHGEKPLVGNELSPQGWARAQALPKLFSERQDFLKNGPPAALYAMAPSHDGGSIRATQTLQFLSKQLNLVVNAQFSRDQISELVQQIRSDSKLNGRTILICWEHSVLLDIARQLGVAAPPEWPGTQFDRVWNLSFSSTGQLVNFENLPEKLLPTDSQK